MNPPRSRLSSSTGVFRPRTAGMALGVLIAASGLAAVANALPQYGTHRDPETPESKAALARAESKRQRRRERNLALRAGR